jgi:spore coat protein H
LFRKVGVPAPLCALSHITVNGEEFGIYSNVEPIKKPFLERVFKDDSGNLYEGPVVDVTKSQYRFLEVKTNEKEGNISDLEALADALEAPDSKLEKQLGTVINLEAFYTFWAMEVLTGHWDSYSGNRNNYYLYHNPEDDLFYFIPWGTDQAFADYNFFRPADQDVTIYPNGEISRRLYALDDGKRFRQRLQELLDEYWDEEDLLDRAEALSALAGTTLSDTDQIVNFISWRRETLADQLKADIDVSKKLPDPQPATCDDEPPRSTGTIEMTWRVAGEGPGPATVEALEVTVQGTPLQFEEGSILGMAYDFPGFLDTIEIGVSGILSGTDRLIWMGFYLPESLFEVGTVPFHGFETVGMALELFPPTYSPGPLLTVITDGELTLERVSDEYGETVRASWDGIELAFVPE